MDSSNKNYAMQVLRKQLKGKNFLNFKSIWCLDIQQNDEIGCSVGLEDENDYFKWNIVFEGPSDTLYEVCINFSFFVNEFSFYHT